MSVSVTPLSQPKPFNRSRSVATITVVGTETGGGSEYVRVKVNGVICGNIDLSAGKTATASATAIAASIATAATTGTTAASTDEVVTITGDDGLVVSISIMSDTVAQTYVIDSAVEDMKVYADEGTLTMTVPGDGFMLPQCDSLVYVVTYKNSSSGGKDMIFTPMVYDSISGQWGPALIEYGTMSTLAASAPEVFNQDFIGVDLPSDSPSAATVATKDAGTRRVIITNHGYNRVGIDTAEIDSDCLVDVWIYGVNH